MSVAQVMSTRTEIAVDRSRCVLALTGWLCSEPATGQQDGRNQDCKKSANFKNIDGIFANFHEIDVVVYVPRVNVSEYFMKASVCIDRFKEGRFIDESVAAGVAH